MDVGCDAPAQIERNIDAVFAEAIGQLTQGLSLVNANVDVTMATADEQIRVSDRVKRELNRLRREGESYNDVLERVLDEDRVGDFYDGFGRWSDEEAERVRERRRKSKEKRKQRMRERAEDAA